MSEQKMPSATDSARKSGQVGEPYQPVWMAHWMRAQGNEAAERRNHSAFGNEEFNHVPRDGNFSNVLDASRPIKEIKAVESKVFGTVKSSENVMTCWPFTNHGQGTDDEASLRLELGHLVERGKASDGKTRIQLSSEIPVVNRGCNSLGAGTSKNPPDWVKIHSSTMDRSLTALKPFKETFVGSSTNLHRSCNLEKHEHGKGKAVMSPLMMGPSSVSNSHLPNTTNMRMLDEEHWREHNDSIDLLCERKMDRVLNKSLLLDAPSTSDHHLQVASPDSFREMQKSARIPLIPSQFIASEKTETKKSNYNLYSLQKLPNCVNDTETMRICTTVDSVEVAPRGFPWFSKTTHSLLITKKTDANLSKEVFRTTQLISDVNGNMPGDTRSLWPFSGLGNRGVKLQPLSSSSNSEEKINVEDAKAYEVTLQNESSADTDTMDVDFCKEWNHGADCYPSTKVDAATSREVGHHWKNTGLPDINIELPALPAICSSPENGRASSSRTQSLEMDMLLAHAEHPKRKSNLCLGDSSETDPIMRWVKRLKLRSPNSTSQGTKSPTLAENSSAEKVGKFIRKILDSGIASSEPSLNNHQTKESIPLDKNGCSYLSDYNEEPPANVKEDRELLLSHVWIKRWLHNGSKTNKKKPETALPSEPTSTKSTPVDIQDKQFPSIAAMALMGKALNGFQSCDLQKQGNFTVWGTQSTLKNR